MKKIALALPVLLLALSGCWPQVGFGPEHQRSNPNETTITRANVTRLREAWSVDAHGQVAEPVTSADTVYVTDTTLSPISQVKVRALRLTTGATAWERTLFSNTGDDHLTLSLDGAPATMSGADLSTGWWTVQQPLGPAWCRGEQVRLDPASGAVRATQGDVVSSGPVTAGDVVAQVEQPITGTRPNPCVRGPIRLSVRNTATGAAWSFVPPGGTLSMFRPTIHDGRILVASDATLYAFPATGCGAGTCEPLWSTNFEVPTHEGTRIVDTPVVGPAGQVFVATSPGRLGGGGVQAVDAATGAVSWFAPGNPRTGGSLAYADGVVYEGADDALYAYRASGCGSPTCNTALWRGHVDGLVSSAPVIAGGVAYVAGTADVYAFDSRGCGGSQCGALTVVGGSSPDTIMYLSVSQGRLFAVTPAKLIAFAPS